jgi:hypothetical protein
MLKRNTSVGLLPRIKGPSMDHPPTSALLLLLVSLLGFAKTSNAQAIAAAEKTGQINAFGTYTFTKPDYGPQNDNGFSLGGEYLFRRFIFGTPAVTVRYSRVTGPTAHETFFGGGVESHYRFGPVRPYATLLYGVGGLSVPVNHYSDSGNELLLGGGVDVPLTRRFAARGEFTYGFLTISGQNGTSLGEINLSPISVNVGVVYHIR